jgi:tetratricopeptide (TPR) repeat protein
MRPLDLAEAMELHERLSGHRADRAKFLSIYAETGGLPARIEALARSGALQARAQVHAAVRPAPGEMALGAEEKRILLALGLLGRPCSAGELCRLARLPATSAGSALAALEKKGLALPARSAGEGEGWLASPSAEKFIETAGERERSRLIEGARHLSLGGAKVSLVRQGLRAARYLQSTYQSRAALDLFRSVLGAMARGTRAARQEVALEMAEILGRTGEIDEGIRILQEFLEKEPDLPSVERARVILRLAALHTRRGDFHRAESLFTEGSQLGGARFGREERLFFLNEYAALKVVVGEHEEGLRLCEEGLRLARRCRSARAREVILNLHATKANIAIRTFDQAAAVREHEEALRVAEATASPNHAVILNNLAIAYGNCDRYAAAIRALREAEELSARLDEGPSIVSIHCNLAVLLAKTGDFKAVTKALEDAEKLSPKGIGIRQQLFLEHASGLAWLYCGRHAQARPHLEAAIELAGLAGDKLVAAFDDVYRAESLVFEGAYGEAASQLERLSEPPASPRIRKLALARLAFLSALTARLSRLDQAAAEHVRLSTESHPVPFLDAWDDVYLGWALAIARASSPRSRRGERGRGEHGRGEYDDRGRRLDAAERFFRRHGLRPGAAVASLARAESAFLEGDRELAHEILESSEVSDHGLAAVLRPLLEARLAMDRPETDSRSRAADLLSDAGAALVGKKLPEWSARLEALRWLLRGKPPAAPERRRLAREIPEAGRAAYTRSAYWKAWTREPAVHPPAPGRKSRSGKAREPDSGSSTTAGAITREVTPARHRPGLVAKSEPMRRLAALLDRVAGADLPVLIEGETGTTAPPSLRGSSRPSSSGRGPAPSRT